ncbi:hypothetical protein [Prauserella cavernicola]|uniref:Uncharacterized protein n=1 Tax=Prauserella cavernicola TaxID=2800127 RepID=A0A934QQ40_9PSEU|nr:hypothetical protein [Prauserella cavernicola]MBK1784550.1 hypothetical protein [Prauserella cavernicola]
MSTRELDVHTGEPRTRTAVASEWVVWHFGELSGVIGPGVLAATVSGWFGLASGLVAAGWAVKETRFRREQQQIRDQRTLPAAEQDTEGETAEDAGTGREGQQDKGVSA